MKAKILGCISPYPTKTENCVGYLVDNSILLDCGPGSTKELDFSTVLNGLTIIISHFHKDHYSDLFAIAYASYVYHKFGLLKEKIKVYIPKTNPNESGYDDYVLIKNLQTCYFDLFEYDEKSVININNYEISFIENYHSIKAYSIKIKTNSQILVYTSDVGYQSASKLIDFAKNCDCLMIESSLLNRDSSNPYHLTAREAGIISNQSSAKKVVLTHFWPEYDKNLYWLEAGQQNNIIIAKTGQVVDIL